MGMKNNKLQDYVLEDVNGQDKWNRKYYTAPISHPTAKIKCANIMVANTLSPYDTYRPRNKSDQEDIHISPYGFDEPMFSTYFEKHYRHDYEDDDDYSRSAYNDDDDDDYSCSAYYDDDDHYAPPGMRYDRSDGTYYDIYDGCYYYRPDKKY